MLALVNGRPEVLDLRAMLSHYISHREEVVTRRTRYSRGRPKKGLTFLRALRLPLPTLMK